MGICLHVVKVAYMYLIACINVFVLLVKITRSMIFQRGGQLVNISQSGNETGFVVYDCMCTLSSLRVFLCVCAGEDSEPGGQCGGNSGTH